MLITRANLKGGRPLKEYPITEIDNQTAFKIGYCTGCNEPLGIKLGDLREVIDFFGLTTMKYKKLLEKFQPKTTVREWLIRWLGGMGNKRVDNF